VEKCFFRVEITWGKVRHGVSFLLAILSLKEEMCVIGDKDLMVVVRVCVLSGCQEQRKSV